MNTTEFTSILRKYALVSKRDIPTIVNTKAFFIARRAVVETPKADKTKIKSLFDLQTGRIAGMIINKRRRERGEKGLYGKPMEMAVKLMKAARLRSVAFLKSGWLPAIKTLAPLAEKRGLKQVGNDRAAKQVGRPKGSANPATSGWTSRAIITNLASARRDTKEALIKYGGPALQRAFDAESASMKEYMERKMKASARESGIKTA